MLVDNRANSDDARYLTNQYLDSKDIDAKSQRIIYLFNRIGVVK